ncbi:PadR family transcriptional regulator [Acidithiobacillus sp. YTS05]|nr:PadR family transcriptional regulator [Acidithiobacillus sp. YTS05]
MRRGGKGEALCGKSSKKCGDGRRRARLLDQGMLRFVILKRLAERPAHGYELIKFLQEQSKDVYSPSPGMLYPMLYLMEDQGYLSTISEGNKRLYQVTEQGFGFLQQNWGLAVAVEERLAAMGSDEVEKTRSQLHALRDAVHERMGLNGQQPKLLQQMQSILQEALDKIQALDSRV